MFLYLAIGAAALGLILFASRGRTILKRREWRFISAILAVVAFAAAAYMGLRNAWGSAVVLIVVGLWFAVSTRRTGLAATPPPSKDKMSLADARAVLGVSSEATREDIQVAYSRLMRMAHPDKGGTAGLAAQLNAARDRLLKG